jgi:dihydroflavonol-4-reductase
VKILVTGATGFVGSEIVWQLLGEGADVRILRRRTSRLDLLGDAATQVEHAVGDVTAPLSLLEAMDGVARVYHAAAYVGFGGARDRDALFRVNVQGTANVVNAALETGVERLVLTSSMAAFGRPERDGVWIDESATWQASGANTTYARSKHEAELEVHRGIAEGLDAVIVNPALIFGVGRAGENTRQLIDKVRTRSLPAVPAGGTNVVDVRDVAAGHLAAMRHGATGERYFLGSENQTWRAIIDTLAHAFGVPAPRFTLPPTLGVALGAVSELFAVITRTDPGLTRELARTSARQYFYRNDKAVEDLGCTFRPFRATAQHLAEVLG